MSGKTLLVALAVGAAGLAGLLLFFTAGSGHTVYVRGEAALARERGEHLLSRRRHTTDPVKRAELLTQAIEQFQRALELKPDFEVAHNMLAHAYIERGQWEPALASLDRALALRADYPAALFNRGRVYQQLSVGKRDHGFIDKAISDYQAALKSELAANFTGDLYKALADAYHQKGDLKRAIEQLKLYLKRAPHAEDAVLVRRKIRGLQLMDRGQAPALSAPLN